MVEVVLLLSLSFVVVFLSIYGVMDLKRQWRRQRERDKREERMIIVVERLYERSLEILNELRIKRG